MRWRAKVSFSTISIINSAVPRRSQAVWNTPCEALADDIQLLQAIDECMDLDESSLECDGDYLTACTNAGVCHDVDCEKGCDYLYGSFMYCDYDEEKEHDVCWCNAYY